MTRWNLKTKPCGAPRFTSGGGDRTGEGDIKLLTNVIRKSKSEYSVS